MQVNHEFWDRAFVVPGFRVLWWQVVDGGVAGKVASMHNCWSGGEGVPQAGSKRRWWWWVRDDGGHGGIGENDDEEDEDVECSKPRAGSMCMHMPVMRMWRYHNAPRSHTRCYA